MMTNGTDDTRSKLTSLIKELKDALVDLKTLEIITVVGKVKAGDEDRKPELDFTADPKVAMTIVDLVDGDISTYFDEEFVTGRFTALRDYHAEKEKQGHEIIQGNLEAIKSLISTATNFLSSGN